MSLRSTLDSLVQIIGKIILFIQLGQLYVGVQFGVVDYLAGMLLGGMSFIDKFGKQNFSTERGIVPIQYRSVAIISEYTPPSDLLVVLQTESNIEIIAERRQDKKHGTLLFRGAKCVAIPPRSEVPGPVTPTSAGLIYMASRPN